MKGVAKASGGEVVKPEMLPKWIDELMKSTEYLDVKQETKKTLWDTWWLLRRRGPAADGRVVFAEALGAGIETHVNKLSTRNTVQRAWPPCMRVVLSARRGTSFFILAGQAKAKVRDGLTSRLMPLVFRSITAFLGVAAPKAEPASPGALISTVRPVTQEILPSGHLIA